MTDDVEVLIPHWNGLEQLRETLMGIRRQTLRPLVCVIDNGSTDGTPDRIPLEFPEVRYIRLARNTGFGVAVNRGARSSQAAFFVLLNNDAVPDERFIEEIVSAHRRNGAEMVAGCLRAPDGTIDSLGVEVDQSLIAYDLLHGRPYEQAARTSGEPLAATAGAVGIAKRAYDRLGGFDEAIFAYLEDVDLGIRHRLSGGRCTAAPRAFAWHRRSSTLGSGSREKNRLMGASRGYLLWKHGGSLSRRQRVRGLLIDAIVYLGQIAIDGNAAALRGRLADRRLRRDSPRPPAHPGFQALPLLQLPSLEALRRRLARRR